MEELRDKDVDDGDGDGRLAQAYAPHGSSSAAFRDQDQHSARLPGEPVSDLVKMASLSSSHLPLHPSDEH